uniref:Uncharacterized protein n=1 Tax=Nelumbo nucifera TaxID=4432 RepID=A0A822YNT7_NELNU|nr:TPA_asm: hypothetical protein HUJ06_004852 [Nelumbo nucifera]
MIPTSLGFLPQSERCLSLQQSTFRFNSSFNWFLSIASDS